MWSALTHKAEEKMVGIHIRLHVTTGTGKAGCTLGGTTYTAVPVYIPGTGLNAKERRTKRQDFGGDL